MQASLYKVITLLLMQFLIVNQILLRCMYTRFLLLDVFYTVESNNKGYNIFFLYQGS